MLRIFSRWFTTGRENRSQVTLPPLELSDVEILREHFSPAPHVLPALVDLVRLITKPLDGATRDRLANYVRDAEPGEDASSILYRALTRDVAELEIIKPSDWCLCICVDWAATNDVEWQANQLLDTLGIADRWVSSGGELTVLGAFLELDTWLAPKGYALLRLDTGNDEYVAFAIGRDDLDEALRLAAKTDVVIETGSMFKPSTFVKP